MNRGSSLGDVERVAHFANALETAGRGYQRGVSRRRQASLHRLNDGTFRDGSRRERRRADVDGDNELVADHLVIDIRHIRMLHFETPGSAARFCPVGQRRVVKVALSTSGCVRGQARRNKS